ncbi:hypothetical protein VCHC22A1_3004, partial [Vibrio cholerae HC-22A1]
MAFPVPLSRGGCS